MSVSVTRGRDDVLGRGPRKMKNVHAHVRRRGSRRRSIRHSYAGWLPQDHGVSSRSFYCQRAGVGSMTGQKKGRRGSLGPAPHNAPRWHADSMERTLPASGEAGQGARVPGPALHSCSDRRARRRLAPRPARTPPRRPVATRVRYLFAASGALLGAPPPAPLRIGFRPASSAFGSVQPVPPRSRPLRLHPRSRRRAGVQARASAALNPSTERKDHASPTCHPFRP